jgi:hypothetical protein
MIKDFFTDEELVFLDKYLVLSPAELHGFLFGIVITPESIPLTKWVLHLIHTGKVTSLLEIEIDRLVIYFVEMHKRITSFKSHEDMDYSFLEVNPNMDITAILDWARGLWGAMGVTPGYWDIDRFINESSDDPSAVSVAVMAYELSDEDALFDVCRHVVNDVAHPLTTISYAETEDEGVESLLKDISLLGSAVYALGERCKALQSGQRVRV